jgi:uncharacterized protein (TIGR03382 family)
VDALPAHQEDRVDRQGGGLARAGCSQGGATPFAALGLLLAFGLFRRKRLAS